MKKKWIWLVPLVLVVAVAVILAVYHDAAYMVFRNLTVPVYEIDEEQDWSGGTAYLGVPYLQSERLNERLIQLLGANQVSYRLVPGMGHASDPLYSDEELGLLETYLREKIGVQ